MRSFIIYIPSKHYWGDGIRGHELGATCRKHTIFPYENTKSDRLGYLCVYERIL
jgi:hypothetical protein